jgi:hypothetical protein
MHLEGAPEGRLPKGSKLVVGKLKGAGKNWAVQSTLIPRGSPLGKSIIRNKRV